MKTLHVRAPSTLGQLAERFCAAFNVPVADRDGEPRRPFTTIRSAVDAAKHYDMPVEVRIAPGSYDEHVDLGGGIIHLVGEPRERTLASWMAGHVGLRLVRTDSVVVSHSAPVISVGDRGRFGLERLVMRVREPLANGVGQAATRPFDGLLELADSPLD